MNFASFFGAMATTFRFTFVPYRDELLCCLAQACGVFFCVLKWASLLNTRMLNFRLTVENIFKQSWCLFLLHCNSAQQVTRIVYNLMANFNTIFTVNQHCSRTFTKVHISLSVRPAVLFVNIGWRTFVNYTSILYMLLELFWGICKPDIRFLKF